MAPSVRPVLIGAAYISTSLYLLYMPIRARIDKMAGSCEFSEHSRKEYKRDPFTGMHKPFITKDPSLIGSFKQYFHPFSFLFPSYYTPEEFSRRVSRKSPVDIRPLNECPLTYPHGTVMRSDTLLAVGGAPAMFSVFASAFSPSPSNPPSDSLICPSLPHVVFVNDFRQWPVENGSAWHIEEDADAEAPTSITPIQFMRDQIERALFRPRMKDVESTGMFPWRSLDWSAFIKSPSSWGTAMRIAYDFQKTREAPPPFRENELRRVQLACRHNEKFFRELNDQMGGTLLLPGEGSIIVARNTNEVNDMRKQKENLLKEGRDLQLLSKDDLTAKMGFSYNGEVFALKPHDRVLNPQYRKLLREHIVKMGGSCRSGTLRKVYTDSPSSTSPSTLIDGGIAEFEGPLGDIFHVPFHRIILSLGNQQIFDRAKKPLFETICAVGASGLALLGTPLHYDVPRVSVFGATNHVTVLSNIEKAPIVEVEGKHMKLHLIRLTAGACVAPSDRGEQSAYYDGTIGVGLMNAVYKTFGSECLVKPLCMYGCNRVVSKHGQISWMEPYKNIHIQYGAGGGGLTRAPDLAAEHSKPNQQ